MKNFQYNFLLLHPSAKLENYKQIDLDKNAELIVGANLEWLLQAYLILKQRGNLDVICSNHFVPGCINIIHSYDLIKLKGSSKALFDRHLLNRSNTGPLKTASHALTIFSCV